MSRRPSYRKPSKAARRAALAEFLAGLPDPPELPDEAESVTTSEIGVPKSVTITEDGKLMHGTTWTLPSDYQAAEVLDGALGSMKGCTPPEWPTLDQDTPGSEPCESD